MEHLFYKGRQRELRLFTLRRIWGDQVAALQYMKGSYEIEGDSLFSRVHGDRTSRSGFKLNEGRFRLNVRKNLLQ